MGNKDRIPQSKLDQMNHFMDDYQVVRKGEIGSAAFLREQAELAGCKVYEYDLESQFRNGGSEKYSEWIDHILHIRRTATTEWEDEPHFSFQIMESPEALEQAIREKHQEGYIARMVAGFCWPWSKQVTPEGGIRPTKYIFPD